MTTTPTEIILPGQASDAPTMLAPSHNTASAMAREMATIQAQVKMAMTFPRDETVAAAAIVNACRRPALAADAEYVFPRGGSEVRGPSIYLARVAASYWGRINSGVSVLERTEDEILIEAVAMDLQTMRIQRAQQRVKAKIQRKNKKGVTEWVEPDERDTAELVGRVGAKLERNCLLALIPPDIIEEACRVARETVKRSAAGELNADRIGQIRALTAAYMEYGVTRAHLEARLKHPLDAITPDEIGDLRAIYKTISAGEKGAADFFDLAPPPTSNETKADAKAAELKDRLHAVKGGKGAKPAESAASAPADAPTTASASDGAASPE